MTIIGKSLPQMPQIKSDLLNPQLQTPNLGSGSGDGPAGASFTGRLANAIEDVANAQNTSTALSRAYELGQEQDLAKVMVSQQVSSLGFQLTLNARNKVLSAYKDIMNMPV